MHQIKWVFILTTCLISSLSSSLGNCNENSQFKIFLEKAKALHLSNDPHWRKLVHYQSNLLTREKSEVDGQDFFLSREGKTNPEAELIATLEGIFVPPSQNDDDHPRCRFPARTIFLKRKLSISDSALPELRCKKFNDFRNRLSPTSATVVFSSYYLNNPSSTFGHSLLRISSTRSISKNGQHHELLDTGINFAADVDTSNPLLYAFYGLTGHFRGTFTAVPYYYKVREYNDYEERDLWSYHLNLTPNELDLLVAHIWELGATYYDYFYFSENCSYHIFTTLEAAAPHLHLTDLLPFYVIPSDTLRILMRDSGLVTSISYRPSIRRSFEYRLTQLIESDQKILSELIHQRDLKILTPELFPQQRARILDAALDYMDFKFPEDLFKSDPERSRWKQELLISRAKLGVKSELTQIPTPEEEAPHLGHGIRRINYENGYASSGAFTRVGIRFALNDLLDPGTGYPHQSQIEFMHLNLRYQHPLRQLELDDLILFRVLSLSPWTEYMRNPSFKVELGYRNKVNQNCTNLEGRCGILGFEVAPGLAFQPWKKDWLTFFGFLDLELGYSPQLSPSSIKLALGPTTGVLLILHPDLRATLSHSQRLTFFTSAQEYSELRGEIVGGLGRSFALGLRGAKFRSAWETGLSLKYYW